MDTLKWKLEKVITLIRWLIIISLSVGFLFFHSAYPEILPGIRTLPVLGITAVVGSILLLLVFGRIKIDQYHYLSWIFDFILFTALLKITGGITGISATSGINLNFVLFIVPLLILSNTISRPWYSGMGTAFLVNLALMYFYFIDPSGKEAHWGFFVVFATLNFGLAGIPFFYTKDEFDDEDKAKQQDEELERAYEVLRKEVDQKRKKEQELYDKTRKLTTVIQLSRNMGTTFHLGQLFDIVIEKAREEMNTQMAFVMLESGNRLEVVRAVGASQLTVEVLNCKIQPDGNPLAQVMLSGQPVKMKLEENPELARHFEKAPEKIKTLLAVPLIAPDQKKPMGVLAVANLLVESEFQTDHEDFLGIIATEAAMFTRQLKLKHDLERSSIELITALAQTIEAKDEYTRGHVRRVSDYAIQLARAIKMPVDEVARIEKAAILHDIGKIATPERVLNKPGRLSDEEFAIMKHHVVESRKMLSDLTLSLDSKVKDYVGYHHERWDGKGYPKGLKGEQIPLGAQIIAVADTFDAMTSDRPYRKGFTPEEALRRLVDTAGSQFNPKVLNAFFYMMGFDAKAGKIRVQVKRVQKEIEEKE
ncbi:MAG: GAF and HD-GYP domain-containing protein [Vulcanimicrobiota bacterium]